MRWLGREVFTIVITPLKTPGSKSTWYRYTVVDSDGLTTAGTVEKRSDLLRAIEQAVAQLDQAR